LCICDSLASQSVVPGDEPISHVEGCGYKRNSRRPPVVFIWSSSLARPLASQPTVQGLKVTDRGQSGTSVEELNGLYCPQSMLAELPIAHETTYIDKVLYCARFLRLLCISSRLCEGGRERWLCSSPIANYTQ
jgi:hypothetical protein